VHDDRCFEYAGGGRRGGILKKLMESVPAWCISVALGLLGAYLLKAFPEPYFRHSVGEACLIAGILGVIVDPFLKARLHKEACQGIFHFLLGFDQPREIQDRLSKIVRETTLYRKNYELKCTLKPNEKHMVLEFEYSFELVNPKDHDETFQQRIEAERTEKLSFTYMRLLSDGDSYEVIPEVQQRADDPNVDEASARDVKVRPSRNGQKYICQGKYSVVYPLNMSYAQHFHIPVIGLTLKIEAPPSWHVDATPTPTRTNNAYYYEQLFLYGDHINIRWKPSSSLDLTNADG
jgi:hypothetical protein